MQISNKTIAQTIEFVESAKKINYNTFDLLHHAAYDLADEVKRLHAKYETPNMPISHGNDDQDFLYCPNCHEIVGHHDLDGEPENHCSNCGTKLK